MSDIGRVNWVRCPNCSWRYYLGQPLLKRPDVPAICPKCRHEFDAKAALEPRWTGKTAADKKL